MANGLFVLKTSELDEIHVGKSVIKYRILANLFAFFAFMKGK